MSRSVNNFSLGRLLGHGLFLLIAAAGVMWTWGAMSVHLHGTALFAAFGAVILATIAAFSARFRARRWGWVGLMLIAAGIGAWYQTIQPSQDRDWAFDVAHGVGAEVEGDKVSLTNVRNFAWQDAATADVSWEDRIYDLSKLDSVDMITSVWDSPDIAHLLVSFGFDDGQRVVFSVETRKESHESFNVKGGFFRQFELVLVAAAEEDIIQLRTNHRREDVRLYPVDLDPTQLRDLFLSYVDLAQQLQAQPEFYNTLTANCTTTVYSLAQVLKPDMSPDWRLVLSGHLPSYVDAVGGFDDELPIEERVERAGITERALAYNGGDYSTAIRSIGPSF